MKLKPISVLLFLVFLTLGTLLFYFLSTTSLALFDSKGIVAVKERNLIITAVSLGLAIIIPIFIVTFFIANKYREGNKFAEYSPELVQNPKQIALFWAIPSVVILILGVINWNATAELDPRKPLEAAVKPMTIQVVALRWKWLFIYPDQNIASVNFFQFPVNTPINFKLTADAPMNSFWIPKLGGQIYAMAGMSTQTHLMASSSGDFDGSAAEINGPGFSGMKFIARASSQADFDSWIQKAKQASKILTFEEYENLAKPSENNKVNYYSASVDNLYDKVIMKFTLPTGGTTAMPGMNY